MAEQDHEIAMSYVANMPPRTGLFSKVGKGFYPVRSHQLSVDPGTYRFCYDADRLYSYKMELAVRIPKGDESFLILNGDQGPTKTTLRHMWVLREAVKKLEKPWCIVPFSAMRAAGITDFGKISLLDTTADRTVTKTVRCRSTRCPKKGPHTHEQETHFLGETLLSYEGRRYVGGMDRNDDPNRRHFYFCRLRSDIVANTVEKALNALRPQKVPKDALRQGEWFLVPTEKSFSDDLIRRFVTISISYNQINTHTGVPILSEQSLEQLEHLKMGGWRLHARIERHRATRMVCNGAVYVSGMLRDEQHGSLKLGDGKTWFKVVKNLAEGSWSAQGDVD